MAQSKVNRYDNKLQKYNIIYLDIYICKYIISLNTRYIIDYVTYNIVRSYL